MSGPLHVMVIILQDVFKFNGYYKFTIYIYWILDIYNGSKYLHYDQYRFPYTDEEQIKNAIVDKWFVLNQKFSKDTVETTVIDENDKVL